MRSSVFATSRPRRHHFARTNAALRFRRPVTVVAASLAIAGCTHDWDKLDPLLTAGSGGEAESMTTGLGGATMGSSSSTAGATSTTTTSSGTGGAPGCIEAEPDLVAYYPLDEESGTIAHDCSGHDHDGTLLSDGAGWVSGRFGGGFAAQSNGSHCIDLGTPSALLLEAAAFTVAAWVNTNTFPTMAGTSGYILGRSQITDKAGWRLGTDPPGVYTVKFRDTVSGTLEVPSMGQPPGTWTHLAVTFDGATSTLYVDGSSTMSGAYAEINADLGASIRIGCRGDSSNFFTGTIDEVRFYDRALTSTEIAALAALTK